MESLTLLKNPKALFSLLKETYNDWSEDKASQLAAALAYYTAFSIAPLLLISIVVAGFVFGREAAQGQIFGQLEGLLGPDAASVIQTSVANSQNASGGTLSAIIGVATLIWSASSLFSQLQDALNTIWEVQPDPKAGMLAMAKRRFLSMTLVLGIAFVLLVSLVLTAGLSAVSALMGNLLPGGEALWQVVNFFVSFALITGLFAAIYKILPDATISWSDVWIGAAVTALLFTVGKFLIGLYLGHASIGSTFGAAGSLLVFLVWVYYSAQILFFGAEFTQVYARLYGSRIKPAEGAVWVDDKAREEQGIPHDDSEKQPSQQQKQRELVAAGAGRSSGSSGGTSTANGTARTNGQAVAAMSQSNGRSNGSGNGAAKAAVNGQGKPQQNGQSQGGGTKGAPDAVKKLLWAGLVSGSMAVGALAARRASTEIWRGILREDPPTKNV